MISGGGRVHEAALAFDGAAAAYERSRPDYPPEAVAFLSEALDIQPGRLVLDLAAGTGKLTRALLPLGARLIAVEPSEGMRRVFESVVPGVTVSDGTAEAIPLHDASVDTVVVGQAFHWFRTGPALAEIARVLRPNGGLGLVWNRRDESVPWVARLGALIDARDRRGAPSSKDESWAGSFGGDWPFGPLRRREFRFVQRLAPEAVVERVLSVSFIASAPQTVHRDVASEVRTLLASSAETAGREAIELPYRTHVYVARLTARPVTGVPLGGDPSGRPESRLE